MPITWAIPALRDIATHEVALDGGVLYYNRAGEGPLVVLLHGLFAQKEQWDALLCLLSAAGYTAIAPDLPGYGKKHRFSRWRIINWSIRPTEYSN